MTKEKLQDYLKVGYFMEDAFDFRPGQDCEIFKADEVKSGDEIIYIPDTHLNMIPMGISVADDEVIDEVLSNCYTGNDFIEECNGNVEKARRLFWYCDWQHTSSAHDEGAVDDDEEDKSDE